MPQPSPRQYPSPVASNVRQAVDRNPAFFKAVEAEEERIKFTPPANAIPTTPMRKSRTASLTVTREEEQAVSRVREGPRTFSKYETLFATRELLMPVAAQVLLSPLSDSKTANSCEMAPI